MQESVSMHKSPTPPQAVAHESSKVGGRGKREGDRKDRGQEADGKKGSPTKKKLSEEQKQGLPGTAEVNKVGGGTLNFP